MGIKFTPPSAEELARRGVGTPARAADSPVTDEAPPAKRKPRRKTPAKPKE